MRFLRWIVGVGAGIALSLAAVAEEPVDRGGALFRRSCAMCHGPDGRAATPMARNMGVKDLSASVLTDAEVRAVIRTGIRGPKGAMPGFATKFDDAELEALVSFVRSLRPPEKAAK